MDPGQKHKDYGYFNVTTRVGESEKGRTKVMIVMHEADKAAYEEEVINDVIKAADCAVFTLKPGAESEIWHDQEKYSEHLQNIREMRVVIAVITKRFFNEDSFAKKVQVPQAVKCKAAVMPLMVETGLIDRFNSDPMFKGMQFLDRTSHDSTEIDFDVKLRNYLGSLVLSQNDVSEIRRHHTGHIFLSYRKKDREYARKLMSIIHNAKEDLAVWFDEFLTPGKHFDEEIKETIKESDVFTMSMTPNMLEKPNYVEEHEYRTAVESGKEIVPVAMQDMGDADIEEVYPGLTECIDPDYPDAVADRIDDLSGVFTGFEGDESSAEHRYYIAMGYLNGIDAETDCERAENLLTEAARQEDGRFSKKAYRRLVFMYVNGAGAERNRNKAKDLQRDLVSFCAREFSRTTKNRDLWDLVREYIDLGSLFYDDEETAEAERVYSEIAGGILEILGTEAVTDHVFMEAMDEVATLPFTRLGIIYKEAGEDEKAKEIIEKGIYVEKFISEHKTDGEKSEVGRIIDEINRNEKNALSEKMDGNYREAVRLNLMNVDLDRELIRLADHFHDPDEARRIYQAAIVGWYSRAANNAVAAGLYEEARIYCNKSLEAFRELGGDIRLMGNTDIQGELFWTYFHLSEVGRLTGDMNLFRRSSENAVRVLDDIVEQSSSEKWKSYRLKMQMRAIAGAYQERKEGLKSEDDYTSYRENENEDSEDDDLPF